MPLNKEQAINLLKITVRTDRRHVDYDRVTKLASRYEKYATGEDIGSLLHRFVKRESAEAFKQREDITSITIPDFVNTLVNPMYKVGRTTANESIGWKKSEGADKKTTDLLNSASKFYGDVSVDDYLADRMVDLDKIDCNSFIVTEFKEKVDPTKPGSKAKPYPFEVNSFEAIDYKYINNELQYLTVYQSASEKFTIYIENEAITAIQVTKEELAAVLAQNPKQDYFYKDETHKENSSIYLLNIFEHKAGRIPARRVGTKKDPATRFRTCVPMIHPAECYFKKAIKTVSEFDLTNSLHVFPKVFRYDNPCKGDMARGLICNDGKDAEGGECSICNGTGWKPQTSTADEVIIRMPKDMKDIVSLENMMAYKSPEVSLIEFQKKYGLYDLKELAIKAVYNGDTFVRDSVAQTATEVSINFESVYDTLKPFADSWAAMKKHIIYCIAAYTDLGSELNYSYSFPKDFKMKPLSVLLEDLKKANDSGVPSYAKKSIVQDIYKKIYVDSPDQLNKIQVKEKFYPFNGKSESEINYILANGIATKRDRVLYAKFDTIFDECEQDVEPGVNFYKLEATKQRELINKKVDEYITLLDEEEAASIGNAFNSSSNGSEGGGGVDTPVDVEAEAKAKLKGSVGGVQGILAIQTQVAEGTTTYSAGLAILELIYGIKGEEGRSILGNQAEIEKNIAERKQQEIDNGNSQGSK